MCEFCRIAVGACKNLMEDLCGRLGDEIFLALDRSGKLTSENAQVTCAVLADMIAHQCFALVKRKALKKFIASCSNTGELIVSEVIFDFVSKALDAEDDPELSSRIMELSNDESDSFVKDPSEFIH